MAVATRISPQDAILDPKIKRYAHLDMLRILAVGFVAVDHGTTVYSVHNVLFTQSWVLQLLWVVCGISWSLYKRSNLRYFSKLVTYFAIGVLLNWSAWLILKMDWEKDVFGVIYQFAFILGLILYAAFTLCIKPLFLKGDETAPDDLQADVESRQAQFLDSSNQVDFGEAAFVAAKVSPMTTQERRSFRTFLCVMALIMMFELSMASVLYVANSSFFAQLFIWALGPGVVFWVDGLNDKQFCGQMISTFGALGLIALGGRILRSPRTSPWLAWTIIIWCYVQRIVLLPLLFDQFGGGVARFFVGFELFLMGMTANGAGLKHAAMLREFLRKFWLLPLLMLAFLWGWTDDWAIRMDEHPPEQPVTILRVQLCEAIWVVSFLAAGSLWFDGEAWTDRLRAWLNDYSLALFLVHKAVHLLVPKPYSWFILFLLLPAIFWFKHEGLRYFRDKKATGGPHAEAQPCSEHCSRQKVGLRPWAVSDPLHSA